MPRSTRHTGLIGEGVFVAWAAARGWDLYRGLDGQAACDFIVDMDGVIARVEVKRAETLLSMADGLYYVADTKLDTDGTRFDYLFISTPGGSYWIPRAACPRHMVAINSAAGLRRPGKYEAFRV